MSDDEIRKQVLKFLRGNSPASSREVRAGVTARAARVDEALRALLSEHRVNRTNDAWSALRSDGTRWGHDAGRVRPSGFQVSYRKAVGAAAEMLVGMGHTPYRAGCLAERYMAGVLPEKQRARMHATNG